MSTAPSTARKTSSRPTSSAPSACSKPCAPTGTSLRRRRRRPPSASCTSPPTRSTARSAKDEPAFTETHRYEPNSPYSASKAASDHLVRAYHHTYGLPVLTTNCSNNYGPYQFPEKLIPLIILNALAGKPLPVYGDGQQIRDWLYVEDHCTRHPPRARSGPGRARSTTSAAGTRSPTSTSSTPSAPCSTNCSPRADGKPYARPDHLRQGPPRPRPPLRHRRRARSSANWAGSRPKPSKPASARPCSGISTTRPGSQQRDQRRLQELGWQAVRQA